MARSGALICGLVIVVAGCAHERIGEGVTRDPQVKHRAGPESTSGMGSYLYVQLEELPRSDEVARLSRGLLNQAPLINVGNRVAVLVTVAAPASLASSGELPTRTQVKTAAVDALRGIDIRDVSVEEITGEEPSDVPFMHVDACLVQAANGSTICKDLMFLAVRVRLVAYAAPPHLADENWALETARCLLWEQETFRSVAAVDVAAETVETVRGLLQEFKEDYTAATH